MSDILCRWLNEELRLSKVVEPRNFAKSFSSGYLIGEVLHKYQLQSDFSMFLKKDTSIAKVNNFTRLEPTLQLLGISFHKSIVQELMQEKQGVATRLLYQLHVSLEQKRKAKTSRTGMETMQPVVNAGPQNMDHEIFSDTEKCEVRMNLPKISQHYEDKSQQKRQPKVLDFQRMKNIEKVPKPPPYKCQLSLKNKKHQQECRARQTQMVHTEIAQFETNRKKLVNYGFASSSSGPLFTGNFTLVGSSQDSDIPGGGTKLILQSNSKYIQDIRQRLEENTVARKQREKRQDRFLVEQFKAHEAQEEARREDQLVRRLTRQTRQEQRLAAQLLQIRMQKEVIRQNRLFREQQYQQRRERDLQEALEREAAQAQQDKLTRAEEIRMELEFCNRMAAERAQSRYKKHFASCKDILEQIVDLATKVGEYRLLTGNLIPEKQMREWKELLFSGLPLYEPIKGQQPGFEFSTPLDPVELQKQEMLSDMDYDEYTNMVGEWAWPEEARETKLPPTNNNILGHLVLRLRNIVHPPIMEPSSPSFPPFTLKACVLGKFCSGKTACLAKIAEAHGIYIISPDTLVQEALDAYKNGEEATEQQEEKGNEQLHSSSTSLIPDLDPPEETRDSNKRLSTRAIHGAAAEKVLRKGKAIPNELLVEIILEAIRQVPAQSGWILDGSPVDIIQAHLLEKALGGSVDIGNGVISSRSNLAADPNPPKPPPPPAPVLDLALLLDIPDECVVRRAFSETDTAVATAPHSTDKSLYLAQTPHRIKAFQDTWPKLEKWFGGKQNILVRVDADVDKEELYKKLESVLQQVMKQSQEALASPPIEDVKAPDSSPSATPPPVDQPPALTEEAPVSHSSLNKEKPQSVKSLSKSNTQSPRGHSRTESTSSIINEESEGGPNNPPEFASPCQSLSSWAFVNERLPPEIPELLCTHWDEMCDSYVNNIKTVLQQLRSHSTVITYHLYNIRENYKHYLGRPDLKQELVSQWTKDFNSIPDYMREDEETKAELHLRLDELCERLWDISDKRKEENVQERAALMGEGWFEDHTAVLINHHSILMQVELDRFLATLRILKVYYFSMYGQVLPEVPPGFPCISLVDTSEFQDKDKSAEPASAGVDDRNDGKETKLRLDSSKRHSVKKDQDQTESAKQPHEKLIADYEDALTTISTLVSAAAHQGETKEQKESLQKKKGANEKEKRKPSSKKTKGPHAPTPAPSPAPADDKNSEKTHGQNVKNKIHKEYAAALDHEENAAKLRIALVKGHGLVMLHSLQSRAKKVISGLEEACYLAEMKSIEQLSEVVRHHIEAGAKLQNELVLELTDFYLNGDCHMVATPPPPPRPPTLQKPTLSTPTITQLESLFQQLYTVAPSGFMSSSKFFSFLSDITSVDMGRNILPEPWINKNERQLMEIVSLLTDDYELTDWRQFLLSAALPWPFPSLMQLLLVLQRFKAADTDGTGYINKEQYLQTELWFPNETVQTVPEDPSEPLPYDILANLRKFFFQLFADHSFSPPRLDYVSMLLYFAADLNPKQGFIRALSIASGQHLKHSSHNHLVRSMPSIGEATELNFTELDREYKEETRKYTPCASGNSLGEQKVSIPALLAVTCHKVTKMKDDSPLPLGCLSQEEYTEHLVNVFRELGYNPEDYVPFSILSQHPFIQVLMETSTHYKLINIHRVLLPRQDEGEANSLTVS